MDTPTIVLVAIVAALAAVILTLIFTRGKRRSRGLKTKYGSEYDYTMERSGDTKSAENSLEEREKRVAKMGIKPLDLKQRDQYQEGWLKIQSDFVDNPAKAIADANQLITEVMIVRGFPIADFEQRAADISVMFPDFVSNYRSANTLALKNKDLGATTEELRQAMVYYRSLFQELLGTTVQKV